MYKYLFYVLFHQHSPFTKIFVCITCKKAWSVTRQQCFIIFLLERTHNREKRKFQYVNKVHTTQDKNNRHKKSHPSSSLIIMSPTLRNFCIVELSWRRSRSHHDSQTANHWRPQCVYQRSIVCTKYVSRRKPFVIY